MSDRKHVAGARIALALFLMGCSAERLVERRVTDGGTLSIAAAAYTPEVGEAVPLNAVYTTPSGPGTPPGPITWQSSSPAIAEVTNDNQLRGVAPGTAWISARVGDLVDSVQATVRPATVASVVLEPTTVNVTMSGSARLSAVVRDARGAVLSGRTVRFTTADPRFAVVASDGTVSPVAIGATVVYADVDGRRGEGLVNVVPAGEPTPSIEPASVSMVERATTRLTATLRDGTGATVPATFAWSAVDQAIVTVDQTGLVTARAAGTTLVLASVNGRSAAAQVTVTQMPVASVTLTPPALQLVQGQSWTFTATVRDTSGQVTQRGVAWSIAPAGIATVNASGTVTATGLGSAVVTATAGGVTGTATVTIVEPPVTSIVVSPEAVQLSPGQSQQFAASGRRSNGTSAAVSVTWSATAGTISADGLFTAPASGTSAQVIARQVGGTLADTATVTIASTQVTSACNNEPSGFTPGLDTPWNALPVLYPTFSSEGWRFYPNQGNTLELVADTTGPKSPGSALRINFPQGWQGGSAPSRFGSRNLPANGGSLYVCTFFRFSAGWDNNGNNGTKMFFFRGYPTEDVLNHFVGTQNTGRTLYLITGLQAPGQGENYGGRTAAEEMTGGVWRKVEILWEANTPGQNNGRVRHWVNDRLVLAADTVRFFGAGQVPRWDYVWFDPTYGGGTNPVPRLQWQEYDHFYVSVR